MKLAKIYLTLVMLSSCAATNKQYDSSRVILLNVSLDPVKADITIDESEKLSGTSKSNSFNCSRKPISTQR